MWADACASKNESEQYNVIDVKSVENKQVFFDVNIYHKIFYHSRFRRIVYIKRERV